VVRRGFGSDVWLSCSEVLVLHRKLTARVPSVRSQHRSRVVAQRLPMADRLCYRALERITPTCRSGLFPEALFVNIGSYFPQVTARNRGLPVGHSPITRLNRPKSARFSAVARRVTKDHTRLFCTMKVRVARGFCESRSLIFGRPPRRGFVGALR
jgi:hypothetical protein